MRQPLIASSYILIRQQKGFSLLVVMAILIVISLIVVGGAQYVNTDLRISANDSDRKRTFTYAESTLKAAESQLLNMETALGVPDYTVAELVTAKKFTETCSGDGDGTAWQTGLCTSGTTYTPVDTAATTVTGNDTPAWERENVWESNSIENTITGNVSTVQPRYIIEILDKDANGTRNYRITARAWGKNKNTAVTLQSYVSVGE